MNDNLWQQSYELLKNGNYLRGISYLLEYIKSHENDSSAYNNLGFAYLQLGLYDKAEENLIKASEVSTKFDKIVYYNLARLYASIGDRYSKSNIGYATMNYKKALDYLKFYLEDKPNDKSALILKLNIEKYLNLASGN